MSRPAGDDAIVSEVAYLPGDGTRPGSPAELRQLIVQVGTAMVAAGDAVDAASASAPGIKEKALVSVAAIGYALVTGATLYLAGHVHRRISAQGMVLLDRIAGILLTAIAVILLDNGFTDMVLGRIHP